MKKKILLLSDDFRSFSGVGIMSKEIILGTLHKFDWVQIGASLSNPDHNKRLDLSNEYNGNIILYPIKGFGNIKLLRKVIETEKPDAIMHFTDPHNWIWLYKNEHEIRQKLPLLYYHVWDNLPNPEYNKQYYNSCDWIGCISKLTYGIVKNVSNLNDKQIDYVPHGVDENIFKPIKIEENEFLNKNEFLKKYEFIVFYNNRNIRRKKTSDVILSYKLFCDMLPKNFSDKCLLLMNTNISDNYGTDLKSVINTICPYDVKFIGNKVDSKTLNELYNISSVTINISNNEGFGLSTLESLFAGTRIITNVTGGLQDQCGFKINNDEIDLNYYVNYGTLSNKPKKLFVDNGVWCEPIWPVVNTLTGSVPTPYIFEDVVDPNIVAISLKRVFDNGFNNNKEYGLKGREWALKHFTSKHMCENITNGIEKTIKNFKPKNKYELIKL